MVPNDGLQWAVRALAALLSLPSDVLLQQTPMLEPLPLSFHEWHRRRTLDDLLDSVWLSDDGYRNALVSNGENDGGTTNGVTHPSRTYGEITSVGARQLWSAMGILDRTDGNSVVFADLGSGTGRLCIQAALELDTCESIVGIEIDPDRHAIALRRWDTVRNVASTSPHRLMLYQGDLLKMDLSKVTHVYVSSLCFDDKMVYRLSELLRSTPRIRVIASLRPLDLIGPPSVVYLQMSWTKPFGCRSYVYRK